MSKNGSIVSGVAERYASALFELATGEGAADAVLADLRRFEALLSESADLVRLVRAPVFGADERLAAISAVLDRAGIGGIAGNFIRLAAKNRRLFAIEEMITAYAAFVAAARGEVTAEVTSAAPLSDAHVADLVAALSQYSGKTVRLDAKVDPSLIGGLIVRLGSRMIDTSLKTKLNSLKFALKEVR